MVTLKIEGQEDYESNHPLITIGRYTDNNLVLNDPNVSQFHARIEQREDGYWLVDQDSSNGTSVNGNKVEDEMLLEADDVILFGGTSELVFTLEEDEDEETDVEASPAIEAKPSEESAAKSSPLLMLAGVVVGLAVISAATVGTVYLVNSGSKCEATARIKSPNNGKMITETTDIELDVKNPQCVQTAIFLLDGKEFASTSKEPFTATLNPEEFGDLADGLNHSVKIVLVDPKGEKLVQTDQISLGFETLATPTPTPEVTETPIPGKKTDPQTPQKKQVGVIETQEMAKRLLKQFSGGANYKFDQQFLLEVNKKTAEYISEGYSTRAMQYRDAINVAYVTEQNLDAPIGYILAMSRSKFMPQRAGSDEGLWRMNNEFVTANAFNGMCGAETLSDVTQNCAARSSALYLKNIVLNIFEGDIIYSIAAFGMSPQEAAEWKNTLPADRSDFSKIIKSPKQREEVVKFIAAGIVAENPQKFGLKKDRAISELYRNLVGN